jgi:hypothetical protein
MSSPGILLVAAGAVALVLLLAVLALRSAARTRRELAAALAESREETRALATRLAALERAQEAPVIEGRVPDAYDVTDPPTYAVEGVIDGSIDGSIDGRIDGRLFADLVARESAIKAAGLVHGLRRALTPENRNRIRFEMRREVKRSRRQRRADLKAALRDLQARERRAMAEDEDAA